MNTLDIIAIIILALSVLMAYFKGLIQEVVWIVSLVVGLVLAVFFYPLPASLLETLGVSSRISGLIGFFGIIVVVIAIGSIVNGILSRVLKTLHLKWIDRLLGGLFGLIRGSLFVAVLFLMLTAFPISPQWMGDSRLAPFFLTGADLIIEAAPDEFEELFRSGYEELNDIWLARVAEERQ